MADYANYKFFTSPDVSHEADPVIGPILRQLRLDGYRTFHILHKWQTIAVTAAEVETRTGYTNLFDGVATPIVIWVDSSDNTQDLPAGTGALTVSILCSEGDNHLLTEETITLNGTTKVTSVDLFEHFNDMKVLTYGTDGEPTGTIQAVNAGDTEQYGQIANTGHCTINARTYIPSGYTGYLVLNARANYNGLTSVAAGFTATEGAQIRWKYVTLDANEPIDQALAPIVVRDSQGWVDITPPKIVRAGAADEYVTMLIDSVDSDVAGLVSLDWQILMWA